MPHRASPIVASVLLLLTLTGFLAAGRPTAASTPILQLVALPASTDGLIRIELRARHAVELTGWEADLHYDPALLALLSLESAASFGRVEGCDGSERCALLLGPKPVLGGNSIGALSYGGGPVLTGDGPLAVLTFRPLTDAGNVALGLDNPLVTTSQGQGVTPLIEGITVELGQTANHSLFLPAVTNQ